MFNASRRSWIIGIVALGLSATAAHGEVRLPHVLGSHMVLQRDMAAPIWGWADPDERVTVSVDGEPVGAATAGADGKWLLRLPPRPAGGPVVITIEGSNTLTLENVLFGDVWVCSGQSNMAWPLFRSATGRADIDAADHPDIRLFTVPLQVAAEPQEDCPGKWVSCSPQTVRTFSAVGYYFGRDLHEALGVPIGLVHSSVGGTPAGAWTPMPVLASNPAFAEIVQRGEDYKTGYAAALDKYEAALPEWELASAQAKAAGGRAPIKPRKPPAPDKNPIMPAVLYNGKIHPLIPLGIKGVIWYQGENNASRAQQYRTLLPAMIKAWRDAWGQGDFAFGIVQLANYLPGGADPGNAAWAELREAQAMVARDTPNCGLATAIDLGQSNDIHPTNKHDVGARLSLWALARVYGRDVAYSGPEFEAMEIEGDTVRITFSHADGGLVVRGGEEIKGFTIAGENRRFVPAAVTLGADGVSVLVRSPEVSQPVSVRYAWANNPACSLYNRADLPALPFRTDDWPRSTMTGK